MIFQTSLVNFQLLSTFASIIKFENKIRIECKKARYFFFFFFFR